MYTNIGSLQDYVCILYNNDAHSYHVVIFYNRLTFKTRFTTQLYGLPCHICHIQYSPSCFQIHTNILYMRIKPYQSYMVTYTTISIYSTVSVAYMNRFANKQYMAIIMMALFLYILMILHTLYMGAYVVIHSLWLH